MKRIIAIVLIILQLFPAGLCLAEESAEPHEWLAEGFENSSISDITAVNSELSHSNMQTLNGSRGALEVSVNKDSGAPSFRLEQKQGVSYDISCWIMMKETPKIDKVQFVFQAPTVDEPTKKAYTTVTVSQAGLRAGRWTKVTARYNCDGKGKLVGVTDRVPVIEEGTVDIRIGDGKISGTSANGSTIDYYLDDLVIIPVPESNDGRIVESGDFENENALNSWTISSSAKVEIHDDDTRYAEVIGKSNMANLSQSVPVMFNTDYNISFRLKTNDENIVGQNVQLIFDRHSSKADDSIKSYEYLKDENNLTIKSEWTTYTIPYRYDLDIETEAYPVIYLRIGDGSGSDISYCIDDIVITGPDSGVVDDKVSVNTDSSANAGSVYNIRAQYEGDHAVTGYVMMVNRETAYGSSLVYGGYSSEPEISVNLSDNEQGNSLSTLVYAVSEDGKLVASGESDPVTVSGKQTAVADFTDSVWTDSQPIKAMAEITSGDNDLNVFIAIAQYDKFGSMVNIQVKTKSVEAGGNSVIEIEAQGVPEAEKAVLYVWDADAQKPLTLNHEISKVDESQLIYVDPVMGNDEADGSLEAPLLSLEAARDAAVELSKQKKAYVMLKGGEYRLTSNLAFTTSSSGGSNGIVFSSYGGKAEIIGSRAVTGWEMYDAEENIYRAYVGNDVDSRQFFVNGAKAVRARSESGLNNVSATDGGYLCSNTELIGIEHPEELEMVYYVKWSNPRCAVSSITEENGKTKIRMNDTGFSKVRNKGQSSVTDSTFPAYYENAYELLDSEGEWYLDKSEGYIYYKPRFFENIMEADAELPVVEKLVTIRGTADNNVSNIEFNNISFKYSTWLDPTVNGYLADTQNNHQSGVAGALPDAAIELSYVNGIRFTNCEFSKMGITAIKLTEGVKNCEISGSEFYDLSGSAISLGVPSGDYSKYINPTDERYVVRGNTITDNYIHHVGTEYQSAAALSAAFPKDTVISNNEIFDCAYSGMHLGYGWATYAENGTATENFSVEENYIHNVLNSKIYDGGAIYTIGNTSGNGYNSVSRNYIKDVKNFYGALYPDEGSQYWEFSTNVFDLSAYPLLYGAGGGNGTPTKWLHLWTDSIKNNRIVNNYSTTDTCRNDGVDNIVEQPVICDNSQWPVEALEVINNSGISAETAARTRRGLQDAELMTEYGAAVGEKFRLSINAFTGKGEKYDYRYSDIYIENTDPIVAEMSDEFIISAKSQGTAYIKLSIVEKGIVKEYIIKVVVD